MGRISARGMNPCKGHDTPLDPVFYTYILRLLRINKVLLHSRALDSRPQGPSPRPRASHLRLYMKSSPPVSSHFQDDTPLLYMVVKAGHHDQYGALLEANGSVKLSMSGDLCAEAHA